MADLMKHPGVAAAKERACGCVFMGKPVETLTRDELLAALVIEHELFVGYQEIVRERYAKASGR